MPKAAALLAAAALAAAGCGGGTPAERDGPPADFFGIVTEDVFAGDGRYRAATLRRQRAAGVRLIRQTFDWSAIEKEPGRYDLRRHDRYVRAVSEARIEILPILFNPPAFHSSRPSRRARRGTYPPSSPRAMARYAAALVRRYGPGGSFWEENPRLSPRPIRSWQIWNEPSFPAYWPAGADAAEYGRLLSVVGRAIRGADPGAEIVAAGLSQSEDGVPLRDFVTALHAAGAGDSYDVLAVHPYTRTPDAALRVVADARALLTDLGSDAPIWITEIGWASDGPSSPFTVGRRRQAQFVSQFLEEAAARRSALGLRGVVYFNWQDAPPYAGGFDFFGLHTGLLDIEGEPKPALAAFTRAVQEASE